MIKVSSDVPVYEMNGTTVNRVVGRKDVQLSVKNDSLFKDRIRIEILVPGEIMNTYTVYADDLLAAVSNASNSNHD